MAWHILLTSPGAEFKVRDELHRLGAWALVPVEFSIKKFGRRENWSLDEVGLSARHRIMKRPVLPGYVFADISNWSLLMRTTVRTVRVGEDDFRHEAGQPEHIAGLAARPVHVIDGKPARLTDREVTALEVMSRPLAALRSPGNRLRPGDRIKIKVGAMADLSACIERITKKGNAVAVFELFGKANRVTLTPEQYEAA